MSTQTLAPVGTVVALPKLRAHIVAGHSESGNYRALCGKVVPPMAQEQADDSNLCANCKRLNAPQEAPETLDETPAPAAAAEPVQEPVAAPLPAPTTESFPVLADKLTLSTGVDVEALARDTDPDRIDHAARASVLTLGAARAAATSDKARKASGREKKPHKPLSERQAQITNHGSTLGSSNVEAGGIGSATPDPVIARMDGAPLVPIGETGMAGSRIDKRCAEHYVGGRYGQYPKDEFDKLTRTQQRRERRKIAEARRAGIRRDGGQR
jgi:hypothetical protein